MDLDLSSLTDEYGIFLARDALAAGWDRRILRQLLHDGAIHRIRHGAYTDTARWRASSDAQRHLLTATAAARSAKSEVVISHTSSVIGHTDRWWRLDLSEVHLTRLDRRAGRREAGIRQHRGLLLPGEFHPIGHGVVRRTSATRAALELTAVADFDRSLIVWDGLLYEGKTTHTELQFGAVDFHRTPGTLIHELLLRECDGRRESVGETRTHLALRGRGLPRPVPQFEVRDSQGQVFARLDFAWPELGVWLEFDGRVKYQKLLKPGESASDVVLRERERERAIERITGWVCVRIAWSDLAHPELIVAKIRAARDLAASRRPALRS